MSSTGLAYMARLTSNIEVRISAMAPRSNLSGASSPIMTIPQPRVTSLARPASSNQVPVTMPRPTMASVA
ncbi:hypothetical protein D3C80_2046970 [compost metagenome]